MKIETKYDIGQEVWFTLDKKDVLNGAILGYCVEMGYYQVENSNNKLCVPMFEDEIFPTKEELLKSL